MERPEVIKVQIEELKKKLIESEDFYRFIPALKDEEYLINDIGFFNLHKAKIILTLLYEGKQLFYKHEALGNVLVKMNPQKNRILVTENNTINEDNIMDFIVWKSGIWYIDTHYGN